MIKRLSILYLFLMVTTILPAQFKTGFSPYPNYDYLLIPSMRDSGKIEVSVFVKNNYDQLIFSYREGKYKALFSVDYAFTNAERKGETYNSSLRKTVKLVNFSDTNKKNSYAVLKDTLFIAPGNYFFSIKGHTDGGRKLLFQDADTLQWKMESGFWFTDFYLVNEKGIPYIGKKDYPFGAKGKFLLPIYWQKSKQPDSLVFYLYKSSGKTLLAQKTVTDLGKGNLYTMPGKYEQLPEGAYRVIVIAFRNKKIIARYERKFTVHWYGKPWSLQRIDLALKPLKAALGEDDFDNLFKGVDEDEAFARYWKKMDPTPESAFNELQEEFYNRADLVQKKYGGERYYGWERDLGKVYLKYGKPEKVIDRRLNPNGKGYILWLYPKTERKFVFIWDGADFELTSVEKMEKK